VEREKENRTEGRKYIDNLDFEITIKNLIEKKTGKIFEQYYLIGFF
jgi:hypothetical protein